MQVRGRLLRGWVERFRHTQLLAMLALLLLMSPFHEGPFAAILSDLLLLATFLSAVFAFADRRSHLVVGLALVAVTQVLTWQIREGAVEVVSVVYAAAALTFFLYFTALVLRDVFRAPRVSADTIAGAVSAYLLIGVTWAFAYALLEQQLPGSIVGLRQEGARNYDAYLGYSFVTLTTLGYGNVVPGNAKADMLAIAEAIVGQVYLTVLVARLVAMSIGEGKGDRVGNESLRSGEPPRTEGKRNGG